MCDERAQKFFTNDIPKYQNPGKMDSPLIIVRVYLYTKAKSDSEDELMKFLK